MNEHSTSHLQSKNQKMSIPILEIVLKMWPYYSHYRRENATPSSGTSILASYKEVPPRGEKVPRINWPPKENCLTG